jgi:autotransporter passenger strand-loop-strand repeat protein
MTTLGANDQYIKEWISASRLLLIDNMGNSGTMPGVHSDAGAIINSGGTQFVEVGGTAFNATVNRYGYQVVEGGTASGTVVHEFGVQTVSGGTTIGTQLIGTDTSAEETVLGGKALSTNLIRAGILTISSGAASSDTKVSGTCVEVVDGGVATSTTVYDGGFQELFNGFAFSTTLSSGGNQVIGFGIGIAVSTQVSSGGRLEVADGGVAVDTTIFGGGIASVSGGTVINPTISAGRINGGMLGLGSGSVVEGAITFGPIPTVDTGGTLEIGGSVMPTATISGFDPGAPGDRILLVDVPFDNAGQLDPIGVSCGGCTLFETTNHVLQICEGGNTYELHFDPSQLISGGFELSSGGGSSDNGTIVERSTEAVTGYSTSALPASPSGMASGSTPPNPYLCTCAIEDFADSTKTNGIGSATAFIIGPHTILTAAHVLSGAGYDLSRISVFPGHQTGDAGNSIDLSGAKIETAWDEVGFQNDYAIIDLPETTQDLTAKYGMFPIVPAVGLGAVNITGYPGQFYPRQYNDIAFAYQDPISGFLDMFNTDISLGNSGSPVWTYDGGIVQAVGMAEAVSGSIALAIAITPSVIDNISEWKDFDFSKTPVKSGQVFDNPSGNNNENILIQDGGVVNNAGGADNTDVQNGGVMNDAGEATSTDVENGGVMNDAGIAVDNAVSGTLNIQAGGTAGATAVYSGGVETISSGGTDLGAQILGTQNVFGIASDAVIGSGGSQAVYFGGIASGTTINSGGEQVVWVDGTANATTVNSGGLEIVYAAGNADSVTIRGGLVDLTDAGVSVGTITFAGRNGGLDIGLSTSVAMINGFGPGNFIDLSLRFSEKDFLQLQDNNVLWIVDPHFGALFTVNLDPTQNFTAEFFHLSPSISGDILLTLGQRHQAGGFDFLGNGTSSDLLFRNDASGDTWFEAMSNGAFAGWNPIGGSDTHYSAVGLGEFFGIATSDILYRNASTGDTWIYGVFAGWSQIGGSDTHYSVAGVGDFFGDGTNDILFRNNSSGDTWFEGISAGAFNGWYQIGGSNTQYGVVGVGDFYGNGISDILFRNSSTGDTWIETISNGAVNGWQQVGGSDTHYSVVGVGDFDGNGFSDILFRNNSTGDTWFEGFSSFGFNDWHQVGGSDTHYAVVGIGDYFNTGTSDILFRNNSTGDTWFEAMSNGAFAGWNQVGGSNTSYTVKT